MATNVDTGLGASERVVAQAKVTGWVLIWPLIWTALSFGLLFWLTIPWLLFALASHRRTELLVTDERFIHKTGLISPKVAAFGLAKFESVRVEQTMVGRMFDYGTIVATRADLSEKRFSSLGGLTALHRAVAAELAAGEPALRAA